MKNFFIKFVIYVVVVYFLYLGVRIYLYTSVDFSKTKSGELITAVERKDHKKLNDLINTGVSVNLQRWDGDLTTPLMTACRLGDETSVHILLTAGANIALRDHDGYDALMWAKQVGNQRIINMLESSKKATNGTQEN